MYTELQYMNHHFGFLNNRSTSDQMFCIYEIQEKMWEYNGTVHQLFIDTIKAYDSINREVVNKFSFNLVHPQN
jgi:hypothetical protein